jgi:VIT1/CCC1 family predicted Fe2+/Mn2+ transporter
LRRTVPQAHSRLIGATLSWPSPMARRILDPVERVSEVIFGLIMVLTFTGTFSAAESDAVETRSMVMSALSCNVAWGFVDGVMYLINTLVARTRDRGLRSEPARLEREDWLGALSVFLLVFLSTLPVVMPFIVMTHTVRALRVSNLVAIVMLFLCGVSLGHYASWRPWRTGVVMAMIGVGLVAITIAFGG